LNAVAELRRASFMVQSVISHCVFISKVRSKDGAEMFRRGTV
jgi:hypothetical protein